MIGLTRQRWNHFELERQTPTESEMRALFQLLGFFDSYRPPADAKKHLGQTGRNLVGTAPVFCPPRDRHPLVRFRRAMEREPQLTTDLIERIRCREDSEYCDFLARSLSLGSYLEAIHVLKLLAEGALPAYVAPARLGPTPNPIVDPSTLDDVAHHRFPCLSLEKELHFFQVSFRTPRLYSVDSLIWNGSWQVLEIDGAGHDFAEDDGRTRAIGLPVRRLSARELLYRDELAA